MLLPFIRGLWYEIALRLVFCQIKTEMVPRRLTKTPIPL